MAGSEHIRSSSVYFISALTFSVNGQQEGTVTGVQVKKDWCSDQVLREVSKERNRPDTMKAHISFAVQHHSQCFSSSEVFVLPLIHILEHTAWSVCGCEDAFVCWNSRCCKEINFNM